jgi:transposase InsO family protein
MVDRIEFENWTVQEAADAAGVSERTAYRWLARWRDGDHELVDRSSVPRRVPRRTPASLERVIEHLRRLRMTSTRIAAELTMAVSTVCAVLARLGLNRLSRLEPLEPANRYERRRPGELIHLDIKKLTRFVRPGHRVTGRGVPGSRGQLRQGVELVHVAIDDHSRVAYVEILPNERAETCAGFLARTVEWFTQHGVHVERVLTDNGPGYRSSVFSTACHTLGIRPSRTQPYRPRTNGKAERFIQTMLREWAYARRYDTSNERNLALTPWIDYYNHRRPHGALGHQAPATRLTAA